MPRAAFSPKVLLVVGMAAIGMAMTLASMASAGDDTEPICERVKTYSIYGMKQTVAFVGTDAEPSQKELLSCAAKTVAPGSHYVYFFNDLARARSWSPVAFGPGPPHEGCLGRAYRESEQDKFVYTPKTEW